PRLPLGDVAGDGRRRHAVGVGEVELPRTRAAREVAVDGADRHLVTRLRDAGPRVDTGPARRLEERRTDLLEQLEVSPLLAVTLHVLRSALDVEPHPRRDTRPSLRRLRQHPGVHVHVFLLARRARAGVGDVHPDLPRRGVDGLTIPGIAGKRHHRPDGRGVDLDDLAV